MKILAVSNPLKRAIAGGELQLELRHTWELYRSGAVREMYARADGRGVVFVMECDDVAPANQLLSGFPLVREGTLAFEVIPLGPLLSLERLFAGATSVPDR